MRKSLKPWVLVITGIIFNIVSAVITHYFIGINNQQLNELQQKASQYDTLIESQWRTKTEIDRNREFLLILLTQSKQENTASIQHYISNQLSTILDRQQISVGTIDQLSTPDFDTIETISTQAKQKIIATINDIYLEKLEVEIRQMPLKEKNSLLFTISIFLQLTGLILVLSKDIMR